MNRRFRAQVAEGNFTRNMVRKGQQWRDEATDWAGGLAEKVRSEAVRAGYQTEHYVRTHPGRFIAGACCVGLATGFLLGRSSRRR